MDRAENGRAACGNTNRTHARTAAAVRDAKCLVQVQMADVRADVRRAAKSDLGVHVGAVHVNLPAMLMNDLRRSR